MTEQDLTEEDLVQRVMWGIHASRNHPSPRRLWAEMSAEDRAQLHAEAEGAIAAYEAHAPRLVTIQVENEKLRMGPGGLRRAGPEDALSPRL